MIKEGQILEIGMKNSLTGFHSENKTSRPAGPGVLNLLVLVYPQIMLNPLRVPPNKKNGKFKGQKDQNGLFSCRF
jgi:hypothetical protein